MWLNRNMHTLLNCVSFFPYFYHWMLLCAPTPLFCLDKFPVRQCWKVFPVLASAGSPWKSIAGYCWNNNHSNRSCKYLLEGNARRLCQPKLISRRRSWSWRIIPACFTRTAVSRIVWNFMYFSTRRPKNVRASPKLRCFQQKLLQILNMFIVRNAKRNQRFICSKENICLHLFSAEILTVYQL